MKDTNDFHIDKSAENKIKALEEEYNRMKLNFEK